MYREVVSHIPEKFELDWSENTTKVFYVDLQAQEESYYVGSSVAEFNISKRSC